MPFLTKRERQEFLDQPGVLMHIACVRADGSPLVTPIWFLCENDAIYFTPRAQSEWFACLKQNPRVSLCIDEQPMPYRKVVLDGLAELVHDVGDDHKWRDLYLRTAKRYTSEAAAQAYIQNTIDQPRALYRVVIADSTIRTWRMPVEGEAPQGIWHERYYAPGSKYASK